MKFKAHEYSTQLSMAMVALVLTIAGCIPAAAQTESVLYSFQGAPDGAQPVAGLIDKAGNLFGTTAFGGASSVGTVFELSPPVSPGAPWTETVLYSFQGTTDGGYPYSALVADPAGHLYGTTLAGGSCDLCGTVFMLTPPHRRGGTWTESTLHSFSGIDGANPFGKLLFNDDGNLYGTTYMGGTYDAGLVFELSPAKHPNAPWIEKVLYNFTGGSDGALPVTDLVSGKAGIFYGTTTQGGDDNFGVVFQLAPPSKHNAPWTETAIYSFTGGSDGAAPYDGVILDGHGKLVGAANVGGDPSCPGGGCGTVYQLTPPPPHGGSWSENTLYAFTGGLDGAQPFAKPVLDGKGILYGTASAGGTASPFCYPYCGAVFALAPPSSSTGPWTETTLYDFVGGSDGYSPEGTLLPGKLGVLYGTTVSGGDPSLGTVFEIVR